jgi:hypothetical protein
MKCDVKFSLTYSLFTHIHTYAHSFLFLSLSHTHTLMHTHTALAQLSEIDLDNEFSSFNVPERATKQ